MDLNIRKQFTELTEHDLELCFFWEFALDEETQEGHDETTVRPNPEWKAGDGLCAVRAEFRFADRTVKHGFILHEGALLLGHERDQQGNDAGQHHYEPTVVIGSAHITFSYGFSQPTSADLRSAYALLGKMREHVFPLSYSAEIPHGQNVEGEIRGFSYRVREKQGFFSRPKDILKIVT